MLSKSMCPPQDGPRYALVTKQIPNLGGWLRVISWVMLHVQHELIRGLCIVATQGPRLHGSAIWGHCHSNLGPGICYNVEKASLGESLLQNASTCRWYLVSHFTGQKCHTTAPLTRQGSMVSHVPRKGELGILWTLAIIQAVETPGSLPIGSSLDCSELSEEIEAWGGNLVSGVTSPRLSLLPAP